MLTPATDLPGATMVEPRLTPPAKVRPTEVWTRYARTAALALRSSSGVALVRNGGRWTVLGRYGRTAEIASGPLLEGIRMVAPGEPIDDETGAEAGIGIGFVLDGDGLAALAVRGQAPRRWLRREWEVLKALADSLRHEVNLRTRLAGSREAASEKHAENGTAGLHLRPDLPDGLDAELRRSILAAVHEGTAEAGDRLPSIREVADACGTTTYAALRAYKALEDEGIVEKRERSGVYIASLGETPVRRLPETATWLRGVVAEGYLLQVKLPGLPDLIHRWTGSRPLRCACIESSEDYRTALCEEIRGQFGLETLDLAVSDDDGFGARADALESAVRRADLIVTTPFHLARVRGLAARLNIPLVVATLDEVSARAIASRVAAVGHVDLVCVDPAFGRRMLVNLDPADRRRVRITSVASRRDLEAIDRARPVLITKAARQRLDGDEFRLVLPQFPAFSGRFAERLAHTIIQLNLEGLRQTPRAE